MAIEEAVVAEVVRETSERMKDPLFSQLAVGHFVESQPELAGYLSARAPRIKTLTSAGDFQPKKRASG